MTTPASPILAWHFVAGTLRDGTPIPPDGIPLCHPDHLPLTICESGLHASVNVLHALRYAPGATLCRVAVSGDIQHQDDKLVARQRTILWRIDATALLRVFARQCALDVAHLWDMPPVVRQYLETGDESLRVAARDAAYAAADAAVYAADADAAVYAAVYAARNTLIQKQTARLLALVEQHIQPLQYQMDPAP